MDEKQFEKALNGLQKETTEKRIVPAVDPGIRNQKESSEAKSTPSPVPLPGGNLILSP